MSRVVRPIGCLRQVRAFRQSTITAGLLSLSLTGMGLVGCSSEEPTPAANQAQGTAAPAGAQPAAAMPAPVGMAPPAGTASPPGGIAGQPGMSSPPGGAAEPNSATALAGATPMPGAAVDPIPMPPGSVPTVAGSTPMPQPGTAGYPMPIGSVPPVAGTTPMPQPGAAGYPMPIGSVPAVAGATPMPPGGAANPAAVTPMPAVDAAGIPMPLGGAAPGAGFGGAGAAPGSGIAGAPGTGAAPQGPQSAPGTAEFSAESIVVQALKGDTSSLAEFISPKCKGVLGDIRDGKASEKQIDDLKKQFVGLKGIGVKTDNGAKVLTLRNADNSIITFRVKKEGDEHKVIEMTIKAGTAKKSR